MNKAVFGLNCGDCAFTCEGDDEKRGKQSSCQSKGESERWKRREIAGGREKEISEREEG